MGFGAFFVAGFLAVRAKVLPSTGDFSVGLIHSILPCDGPELRRYFIKFLHVVPLYSDPNAAPVRKVQPCIC